MPSRDFRISSARSNFNDDFDASSWSEATTSSISVDEEDAWGIERRLDTKEQLLNTIKAERLELLNRLLKVEDHVGKRLGFQRVAMKMIAAGHASHATNEDATNVDRRSTPSAPTLDDITIYWAALTADVERLNLPVQEEGSSLAEQTKANREDTVTSSLPKMRTGRSETPPPP